MKIVTGSVVDIDEHVVPDGHPERHARLEAVRAGVDDVGLGSDQIALAPRRARITELARVHDELYLDAIAQFCEGGGGDLDADTATVPGTWATALAAAGLGLAAIDALRGGAGDAAFVATRPPGHHATRDRGMGFCLVNNVAVAAAALAAADERVAIIDWDVHHGNGTQEIFWNDNRVLYSSVHQWPAYPGTGRVTETGGPDAPGLTVNVPVPAGATGDVALAALDDVVGPAIDAFSPTWVIVSAGYDAHRDDPLADLAWSAGDYARLTELVSSLTPTAGRLLFVLEGGYDLNALRNCVRATVSTLGGEPCASEPPTSGGPGLEAVRVARRLRSGGT